MQQITLSNVEQNNLKIRNLNLPLNSLILFSGPSGSGKSSLAIDTLLQEGQRRCFEALRASFPIGDKYLPRPKVGQIQGLPPTFGMKQDMGMKFDDWQSIASLVGVHSLLEQIFLQKGSLHCPSTHLPMRGYNPSDAGADLLKRFSGFRCHVLVDIPFQEDNYQAVLGGIQGQGYARVQYNDQIYFIEDTPQQPPTTLSIVVDRFKIRLENIARTEEALRIGLFSSQEMVRVQVSDGTHVEEVIYTRLPYSNDLKQSFPLPEHNHLNPRSTIGACDSCLGKGELPQACSTCKGTGLSDIASMLKICGLSFQEALLLSSQELMDWLHQFDNTALIQEINHKLELLLKVNITLPISRRVHLLSTGERSRVRLCGVLSQQLGQVLYILDEPSLGLSDVDVNAVIALCKELVEQHQSIIVVDHHPLFHRFADQIVHFGPGAGTYGGQIVTEIVVEEPLKKIDVSPKEHTTPIIQEPIQINSGQLVSICGPSGCGKSTILETIKRTLQASREERIIHLSQLASQGNKRSCVVTIAGIWSQIRTLLANTRSAKIHRLNPADFSFNRRGGRCEECYGLGTKSLSLPPLPPVEITCPECKGKRFQQRVLNASYRDHSIHDILELTIQDARKVFEDQPNIFRLFQALDLVGLGYITLGQTSPTLSGGEQRRIQLAKVLAPCLKKEHNREPTIVLLDDPTAALHPTDAIKLQRCLLNLRESAITTIMVTNNPQMLEISDKVYTLG